MKLLQLCILSTLALLCATNSAPAQNEWTDPTSGTKYDFSSLKRDSDQPWKVKDGADNGLFSMIYYFNFGASHNKKCKGQSVAVSEVLEVLKQPTDTCEILGKLEVPTYGLLDPTDPRKGLYVQYGGGDKCTNGDNPLLNGKPRQSKFKIYCADKQDDFVVDLPGGTQGTTKCLLEFKINSPAGCPGGSFGASKASTMLFWIVLFFSSYFMLGTIYNIKQNNLSGKEAIPNIEFWRTFPDLVKDGMAKTVESANKFGIWAKGKISGNNTAYNEL